MFEFPERAVGQAEIIDDREAPANELEKNYSFMEEVNRYFGGCGVILSFLEAELESGELEPDEPLEILDLGSGGCDIPAAVLSWAEGQELPINYTCLEKHPAAISRARKKDRLQDIRLVESDLFAFEPDSGFDYVTLSLVLHHFSPPEIRRIINKYAKHTERALVVNDLRRHRLLYGLTWLRTLFSSRENRHDALLSVRKGFRAAELRKIAGELPGCDARVDRRPLFRLRAVLRFREARG